MQSNNLPYNSQNMAESKRKRKVSPEIQYDYRVRLYEDGKYHWMYDLNLMKNPSVLIDVYKMLGMTLLITAFILFMIQACTEGLHFEGMGFVLKLTGVLAGILLVLGLLGYLLYAVVAGGIYTVHFTMDENGFVHEQAPRSQKVAERIGCLAALVGIFARRPSVTGSGMIAASRTSMSSHFSNVKKVKALRRMNTIMVNEPFGKNRVYVNDEDFDFVYDFIIKRCPKAGKK